MPPSAIRRRQRGTTHGRVGTEPTGLPFAPAATTIGRPRDGTATDTCGTISFGGRRFEESNLAQGNLDTPARAALVDEILKAPVGQRLAAVRQMGVELQLLQPNTTSSSPWVRN